MNRRWGVIIAGLIITLMMAGSLSAVPQVKLIMNGQEIMSDVPAQIIGGRTMVPLRLITETMGGEVEWDEKNYTVTIKPNKPEAAEWNLISLNGEPTTWPYWIRDGKLYLEYRNAIQLVREGNRAPLHSVAYFPHSNTLYVDDLSYPLSFNKEGNYQIVSIDYFRDLGIVNFHWDAQKENIQLIYR